MKTFIYNIYKTTAVNMGGRKQYVNIYRVKNNTPIFLGETKWNTASYYGESSEVMHWLANNSYIPKKWATDHYRNYRSIQILKV